MSVCVAQDIYLNSLKYSCGIQSFVVSRNNVDSCKGCSEKNFLTKALTLWTDYRNLHEYLQKLCYQIQIAKNK